MSTGTIPPVNPDDNNAYPMTVADATNATNYVESELVRQHRTLNITRAVGALLVLLALAETIWVTGTLKKYLEPKTAADVATGMISSRLDDQSDAIRDGIAQRVPMLIAQIPDDAISQMPTYRERLETTINDDINSYAQKSSANLNDNLDQFLTAHKDEVHDALTNTNDKATVDQLASGLAGSFVQTLKSQTQDGETLQAKIDKSMADLSSVKAKMDRLAKNKGLTPDEKQTRHLIAIMAHTIEKQTPHVSVTKAISGAAATAASPTNSAAL